MKKLLILILCIISVLCIVLTACNNDPDTPVDPNPGEQTGGETPGGDKPGEGEQTGGGTQGGEQTGGGSQGGETTPGGEQQGGGTQGGGSQGGETTPGGEQQGGGTQGGGSQGGETTPGGEQQGGGTQGGGSQGGGSQSGETTPGGEQQGGGTQGGGQGGETTPGTHEHDFDEGEVTKPANCMEEGELTKHCKVQGCTETKKETIPINDKVHKIEESTITRYTHSVKYACTHVSDIESGEHEFENNGDTCKVCGWKIENHGESGVDKWVDDSTVDKLSHGGGSVYAYIIPNTHNGKQVTKLGNGTTSIFQSNSYIERVVIPWTVKEFAKDAFSDTTDSTYKAFLNKKVTDVFYEGTKEEFDKITGLDVSLWNTYDNGAWTKIIHYYSDTEVAGAWRWEDNRPKLWPTPDTDNDYQHHEGTAEVKFDRNYVAGGDNLKGLVIIPAFTPNDKSQQVTGFLENAFKDKNEITAIVLPDTITFISKNAFSGCSALETVYFEGTEAKWKRLTDGYPSPWLQTGNDAVGNPKHVYFYSYKEQAGAWHWVDDVPTLWDAEESAE